MKSINKIIPLVIYPFDVMISFGESDKQIGDALRGFGIIESESHESLLFNMDKVKTLRGRMVMFSGKQTVLRLNFIPKTNNPEHMGLLQHEIFHAVGFIMQEINTPLNEDTHETYAYLIGYLTEKIYLTLKSV
jgi:hypothetical protein